MLRAFYIKLYVVCMCVCSFETCFFVVSELGLILNVDAKQKINVGTEQVQNLLNVRGEGRTDHFKVRFTI